MQPINLVAQLILRTACEVGMDTNWDRQVQPSEIRDSQGLDHYRLTDKQVMV